MLGPELIRRLSGGRRLALCGAEEGSTAEIKARAGVGPGGEGGGGGGFEGGGGKGGGGGGGRAAAARAAAARAAAKQ